MTETALTVRPSYSVDVAKATPAQLRFLRKQQDKQMLADMVSGAAGQVAEITKTLIETARENKMAVSILMFVGVQVANNLRILPGIPAGLLQGAIMADLAIEAVLPDWLT